MNERTDQVLSDAERFRKVLGHFPTGVVVVTSTDADGAPVGMTVGSFTSVSLKPPLVAFLPDRSSTTFPTIRDAGRFCVNVLASTQAEVGRTMAFSGADKFAGLTWTPSTVTGSPLLHGIVAFMDCDLYAVHEAGDHYIAIGHVRELGVPGDVSPLLFFQGGYGRFHPEGPQEP